jgi:hypothetical protein
VPVAPVPITIGSNPLDPTSTFAVHVSGSGQANTAGQFSYAQLTAWLNTVSETQIGTVDASQYTGVQFYAIVNTGALGARLTIGNLYTEPSGGMCTTTAGPGRLKMGVSLVQGRAAARWVAELEVAGIAISAAWLDAPRTSMTARMATGANPAAASATDHKAPRVAAAGRVSAIAPATSPPRTSERSRLATSAQSAAATMVPIMSGRPSGR